jgi:hypothetical protein
MNGRRWLKIISGLETKKSAWMDGEMVNLVDLPCGRLIPNMGKKIANLIDIIVNNGTTRINAQLGSEALQFTMNQRNG